MHTLAIRNLRINKSLSEETLCFSATVVVDGWSRGTVKNRGHGGCHEYDFDTKSLDEWAKAQKPDAFEPLDSAIDDLVFMEETRQIVARKIMALAPDGKVYEFKKSRGLTRDDVVRHVKARKPDYRLLHEMPLEEAAKLI